MAWLVHILFTPLLDNSVITIHLLQRLVSFYCSLLGNFVFPFFQHSVTVHVFSSSLSLSCAASLKHLHTLCCSVPLVLLYLVCFFTMIRDAVFLVCSSLLCCFAPRHQRALFIFTTPSPIGSYTCYSIVGIYIFLLGRALHHKKSIFAHLTFCFNLRTPVT